MIKRGVKRNQGKYLKSPKRVYSSSGNSKRQTTETKSKKRLLSKQFFSGGCLWSVYCGRPLHYCTYLIYGTEGITEKETKLLICYKFNYSPPNTACSLAGNSIVIIIVIIAIIVNISIEFVPSNNANFVKYTACSDRVWGSPMILI